MQNIYCTYWVVNWSQLRRLLPCSHDRWMKHNISTIVYAPFSTYYAEHGHRGLGLVLIPVLYNIVIFQGIVLKLYVSTLVQIGTWCISNFRHCCRCRCAFWPLDATTSPHCTNTALRFYLCITSRLHIAFTEGAHCRRSSRAQFKNLYPTRTRRKQILYSIWFNHHHLSCFLLFNFTLASTCLSSCLFSSHPYMPISSQLPSRAWHTKSYFLPNYALNSSSCFPACSLSSWYFSSSAVLLLLIFLPLPFFFFVC